MGLPGGNELITIFIILSFSLFPMIAVWKIIVKAGYSGILILLGFIPVINIVMLFVFAFSEWPIEKNLREAHKA